MAEKQILVRTPVTTNGIELLIGEDGRVVYKETILAAGAKALIERQNNQLPDNLKHKISDYTPEPEKVEPAKQTVKP